MSDTITVVESSVSSDVIVSVAAETPTTVVATTEENPITVVVTKTVSITGGGGGDVAGPASSVNNNVVFFDGLTGKAIKDSGLTLAGSNTGDVTIGTANGLSVLGQALSLQAATNSVPGALTAADHTTFAAKEPAITAGTTAQYFRGDKSLSTFSTDVLAVAAPIFTPVAIKVADFNANPSEFIPVDLSSGNIVGQLPTAPVDGSSISVNIIQVSATGVLELKTGGTDIFLVGGGATSTYMSLQNEGAILHYQASTGIWFLEPMAASSNFATGFPGIDAQTPITNADISINYTTRVLTITPPLGYFNFYTDGGGKMVRHRKGVVNFPAFTDTSGMWYFYFDSAGTAVTTQTAWTTMDFDTNASIYRILWNATLTPGVAQAVGEYIEYHLNTISADDHQWYHLQGAIWSHGLASSSNVLASGVPDADGRNAVIGLTEGMVVDDNLEYMLVSDTTPTNPWEQDLGDIVPATLNATNGGQFQIFTQDAAGLFAALPATHFPFSWNSGTNLPQYISSVGAPTAVPNGYFFVYFLYATQNPRVGESIKIVSAPATYTTITDARAYTWTDIQAQYSILANDPEIRPLYRMVFEYRTIYDIGTKKTALRELQDLRKGSVTTTVVASGSLPASSVTFIPTGDIASTNVQSALVELDDTKVPITKVAVSTAMMTEVATGFTLAGGTTTKTLTVALDASVAGTNTGDQTGGTPALTLGTTNTAGTAATFIRTDDTILTFDATDPTTQAFSDVAAVGVATVAARRDHKHAMMATPTTISGNAGSATYASAVTTASEATDTSCYIGFVTDAAGNLPLKTNAGLTYNSATSVLTATGFAGPLTGNVTGNVSGSSGSCTGNAATVTTNANLTGVITSAGNATSIASQTGTGSTFVVNTSPTIVTGMVCPAIDGSIAANGDLTLQGTTDATRTTSYVILQPNGGYIGMGGITAPNRPVEITGAVGINTLGGAILTEGLDVRYVFAGYVNSYATVVAMTSNTTDTMSNGFGVGCSFYIKDSAVGPNQIANIAAKMANSDKTTGNLGFWVANAGSLVEKFTIQYDGKIGMGGITVPTAALHLPAGTATASTAPLKLTTGTVNTTAEAGTVEYNNTFHLTNSDATRRHIATAPNTTKVTAAAPYTNDGYVVMNIGGTDFKVMTTA